MEGTTKLANSARTLSVLMDMFETVYMPLLELPEEGDTAEKRAAKEMACVAFYHLRDMADEIATEADGMTK